YRALTYATQIPLTTAAIPAMSAISGHVLLHGSPERSQAARRNTVITGGAAGCVTHAKPASRPGTTAALAVRRLHASTVCHVASNANRSQRPRGTSPPSRAHPLGVKAKANPAAFAASRPTRERASNHTAGIKAVLMRTGKTRSAKNKSPGHNASR